MGGGGVEGLEQLHLIVADNNLAAKKLYTSLGFKSYGLEPRALKIGPDYFDDLLMVYFLH
ncbi:MAG: hypothetical protein R2865_02105 [Deinococcales bacterium]